jgi:hypothetical protein
MKLTAIGLTTALALSSATAFAFEVGGAGGEAGAVGDRVAYFGRLGPHRRCLVPHRQPRRLRRHGLFSEVALSLDRARSAPQARQGLSDCSLKTIDGLWPAEPHDPKLPALHGLGEAAARNGLYGAPGLASRDRFGAGKCRSRNAHPPFSLL